MLELLISVVCIASLMLIPVSVTFLRSRFLNTSSSTGPQNLSNPDPVARPTNPLEFETNPNLVVDDVSSGEPKFLLYVQKADEFSFSTGGLVFSPVLGAAEPKSTDTVNEKNPKIVSIEEFRKDRMTA